MSPLISYTMTYYSNCEWLDDFDSDNWSVIGNIFDNPELITEQEENNE